MSIRTYARSRVKRKSFFRKSELQMFLLISGGHVGAPKRYTNIWRLHTLEKVRETFQKITQKLCATTTWDLDKLFMNGFQFTFFVAWQWKRSIRRLSWVTHVNRKWDLFHFDIPWRCQICLAKYLYSYRDDLPENLGKTTEECKKPTSGRLLSLKIAFA